MSPNAHRIDQLRSEIQSEPVFYVRRNRLTRKHESQGTEPSGFLSKDEAAAFWRRTSPLPFPSRLRQSPPSLQNSLDRLGPLKKDVSDLVLLHLFSDCHSTTHVSMFGVQPHPVFRVRTKQPVVSATTSKDNVSGSRSTNNKTEQPFGTKAQLAFLIRNKVLPKSDNPSFKDMFPSTDLPHISFVNGLPKCNKSTFNQLLISKLRASKTSLGLKSTDRLSRDIVVHVSRLIDKALVSAFKDKKSGKSKTFSPTSGSSSSPRPSQEPASEKISHDESHRKPKKEKKKKTLTNVEVPLTSRFTSAEFSDSPMLIQPTFEEVQPSHPASPPPVLRNTFFEPEQSLSHLRPDRAKLMYDVHRRLNSCQNDRMPLTPALRASLGSLGFGYFFSIIRSSETVSIQDIQFAFDCFVRLVNYDGPFRPHGVSYENAPSHDSVEDDLLPFYRDRSLSGLQRACDTLEILVMEIRSLE